MVNAAFQVATPDVNSHLDRGSSQAGPNQSNADSGT
jgi:hypothetical protein